MQQSKLHFVGVEIYFDDLETAKRFYRDTLQLELSDEQVGHYAKFGTGSNFIASNAKVQKRTRPWIKPKFLDTVLKSQLREMLVPLLDGKVSGTERAGIADRLVPVRIDSS